MTADKTLVSLEYTKITERASGFAVSAPGKAAVAACRPEASFEAAAAALALTAEAYRALYTLLVDPISDFDDIADIADRAEAGSCLAICDIYAAAKLMAAARRLKTAVAPVNDAGLSRLKETVAPILYDKAFEEAVKEAFVNESEVADGASSELRSVRRSLASARENIRKKLGSYLSDFGQYLQDEFVTMRGERFVLPVKAEYRGRIDGLVHDRSASGSTYYVEPFAVVELNNGVRELLIREQEEIYRILYAFTVRISDMAPVLRANLYACTQADAVFAKARYANSIKGTYPELTRDGTIEIKAGRHPLIDPQKVVPVSVSLGSERIMLVSGPNTGGKTVTLKMAGLFACMAAAGFYLPAAETSRVSFFDSVFCDIGDEQNIELSLSTFSSHMRNIIDIMSQIIPGSLVLLDEAGGGTDPDEGAALAIGIIEYIYKTGAAALLTTHYSSLKEFALTSGYIKSASMQFDKHTLLPTYKILDGIPGTSNALAVAGALGMRGEVLESARARISEGKRSFETLLRLAESTKTEADERLAEAEAERNKYSEEARKLETERVRLQALRERLAEGAKTEVKRLAAAAAEQAEGYLEEIKRLMETADNESLLKAKMLRTKIKNIDVFETLGEERREPVTGTDLETGREVYVLPLSAAGVVAAANPSKDEYSVYVGNALVTVGKGELARADGRDQRPNNKAQSVSKRSATNKKEELNKTVAVNVQPYSASPL
ncbi:MAG: hypothetical protein FWE62_05275, partial [Firmicutes bacterium]|nr:hypothetical protein [Bacillota bacterium]